MNWSTANCAERALSKRRKAYAALDLGTNNCRLMIAVARRQGFSVVDTYSRIVRLGEGLATTGRLSEEAQNRAVEALRTCAEVIARWEVAGLHCVTTEACRSASNGAQFVERVRRETGLRLDIIGPEQEARLALAGCSSLIDAKAKRVLVFDIGGGSTELCLVDIQRRRGGPAHLHLRKIISMPFGVVRLSDGLARGGFAGEHYRLISERVAEAIRAELDGHLGKPCCHLIGTSGTATSLAALHKGLKRYRRRDIDGSWLGASEIARLTLRLQDLGYEGRRREPCIGEGRADLIMPGCAILEGILAATGKPRVRVGDRGLREGLIAGLLAQKTAASGGLSLGPAAAQPAE